MVSNEEPKPAEYEPDDSQEPSGDSTGNSPFPDWCRDCDCDYAGEACGGGL